MTTPRKRIRPVIEEIIDNPAPEPEVTHVHEEVKPHKHMHVEEEVVADTRQEVAQYDEPPLLERVIVPENPEHAARKFLESNEDRRSGPNLKLLFIVTILTALIVGFIAGGVYVYVSGVSSNSSAQNTPTPTSEATIEPTATPVVTPKASIAPGSFTVSVLNGSGVIGAASKVKAALEGGGFKVTGTGNAVNYNFKNTVIQTKSTVPAQAVELLKTSLKDYVIEEGDPLPASSTFDIIVTAGKQ